MTLATIGLAALAVPILLGVLNAPAIRAQDAPAATPKFDVASIKPTGGRGRGSMRPWPGRLTATAPLRVLMEAAYHVQPFQIVDGPEWIRSDQYEIDARATGNPGNAQIVLMLRSELRAAGQERRRKTGDAAMRTVIVWSDRGGKRQTISYTKNNLISLTGLMGDTLEPQADSSGEAQIEMDEASGPIYLVWRHPPPRH